MYLASLINKPNVHRDEVEFEFKKPVTHRWCQKWRGALKKGVREPFFYRVENGPIHCELCGRRASKLLRRIILHHCLASSYEEALNDDGELSRVTFYRFLRSDLHEEGLQNHGIQRRLIDELDTGPPADGSRWHLT